MDRARRVGMRTARELTAIGESFNHYQVKMMRLMCREPSYSGANLEASLHGSVREL